MGVKSKFAVVVGCVLALYLVPGVKTAYDALYAYVLVRFPGISAFDSFILKALPFFAVGDVFYIAITAFFKKREQR